MKYYRNEYLILPGDFGKRLQKVTSKLSLEPKWQWYIKENREDEKDKRNHREKKSNIWQMIQSRRQERRMTP